MYPRGTEEMTLLDLCYRKSILMPKTEKLLKRLQ